jgi:hypothetical protein
MSTPSESKLTELRSRAAEIDVEVANLDREFANLAGAFDVGDKSALKRADSIEQQTNALRRERAILIARQHNLHVQRQAEAKAAEQEERRKQEIAAKQIADALAALHVDLDRALVGLREQLERRASLLGQLSNSGAANTTLLPKLLGKASVTRAACAAGLHRHIGIETVAPQSFQPLASINQVLLGIAPHHEPDPAEATTTPEAEPEQPRPQLRLRGNGGAT